MSWKAVEMQVAIPRTQDAGRMQAEHQKQSEHLQGVLAQVLQQQEEIKLTQISHTEESALVKGNKKNKEENIVKDEWLRQKNKDEEEMKHPYLGTKIDLNL